MKTQTASNKFDSTELHRILASLEQYQSELEAQNHELREAQRLLEDSRNSYANLYDFAPVAYLGLDKHGCIQRANLMAIELLGKPGHSPVGMPLTSWIAPGYTTRFFEHLRHCNQGLSRVVTELALVIKGRPQVWVQLTSSFDNACDNKIFQSALLDVTERKLVEDERMASLYRESAARAEAESLNRAKDEFLATVSHELRTPIQSVLMWSQMLQVRKLSKEEVKTGLSTIEQSVRSQSRLIESLLDVSKITLGKLDLELKRLDLGDCLQKAYDAVRAEAEAKLLRMSLEINAPHAKISGDNHRLQQVFGNILCNSIKFTDAGGLIQVTLTTADSEAHITVSDTGVGMTNSSLNTIFERFVCSPDRTRRGLGLGLAIARDLVRLHGGSISASSGGQNKGSCFTVTLPLAS